MTVVSTEVLAAETLADMLFEAQNNDMLISLVMRTLRRFAENGPASIPLKDVAAELGVTLPTVRDWIERGLLVEASTKPRAVSLVSLATVLAARRTADLTTTETRPLAKLLDTLEDQRLLCLAREVAADPDARFISYSDEDLHALADL